MTSNVSLAGRGLLGEVGNVSTHPFDVAAVTALPSIKPEWSGRIVNCTDCHGNSDPAGDRGPHESFVPGLLVKPLQITDGHAESTDTYDLCYECHDRESILRGDSFDGHRRHVVDLKISCETCHDPHGSASNRALIRIGDGTIGIAPSQMAGRLAFESDSPGSGSCYLTCHGYDHAPERYGPRAAAGLKTRSSDPRLSIKRRRPVARPHLPHLP